MSAPHAKVLHLGAPVMRIVLVGAEVFALVAYLLGLAFLLRTSGGTLFLFSTVAPLLAGMAALAITGVLIYRFVRKQSLFVFAVFEPGDVICMQGEEGGWAYFIQSGEVEVVREEDDIERFITRLSKGHHFGEAALVSDTPHFVTVRAVTRTRVAALGRRNFLSILRYSAFTDTDFLQTMNSKAIQQAARRARKKS
jgi:Cyclic nucleotide-binding domain